MKQDRYFEYAILSASKGLLIIALKCLVTTSFSVRLRLDMALNQTLGKPQWVRSDVDVSK
jgi:hypothetical protein